METIDINELKFIKNFYSSGNFSKVHIVSESDIKYCFKVFHEHFPDEIINNIGKLTERDFPKNFLVPRTMVINKGKIMGYLSRYYENNFDIELISSYDKKITILKNTKKLIETLHNDYKLIHGDIHVGNILSNENFEPSIIDFDSTLEYEQILGSSISIPQIILKYLKYYKYDYKADIYFFNITTLKYLNNIYKTNTLLNKIKKDKIYINEDVKKLTKELILYPEDIKKEYSGEYIIDYI